MADVITLIVGSVALYLVNLIVGIVAPYLLGLFNAVAPRLLDLIGRELDYLFHYRSNIEKLSKEVVELQKVSERIEADWTNAGEIELNVQEWLTSVDGIIKNALKFLEDEKKENEGFFNRLCAWLNLKSWYQKSKKAKQTAAEIVRIQDGKQLPSSPPPRKIRIPAVEGYEAFKSRMPILNKIMESLRNANVNLIGVYGMGGTGKTTLVKEIAKKCEEDKLFDEVVIATVSQPLNITNIQGEIADKLNLTLTLKEETKSGRAGRLCEELKKLLDKKQSILVILDDIWEKLNLAEVGIPFGDNYRGCKVVMTSRNQHVLSNEMCTQETFNIEVLWEEEAWDLFKKIAGDSIEDHDRKPIARGIVEECARLPIAIVTVANALKNKRVPIWKDALRELENSTPTGIKGMEQKVYSALKWSYDFLEDEKAKSLFLLCSLLPEDYQFSILDILKFGEGVDLFQGINLLEDARNKVDTLVNTLTDSSLLLHDKTTTGFRMLDIARDKHFRMHDIVRDVGISVASKDKHMLIVRNDDEMEEQMRKEKHKDCPAISLPCSDIHELPTGLECPKLTLFLFFSKDSSLKIPDTFFEGMKQLKVLNLKNMCFSSLPSSLSFLLNLQTLCLDDCVFQDIPRHNLARIGELKKLEVLSFASSNIAELPREIGQLTCLRLLDLRNCSKLEVIPPNVIEKFTRLEDLYMEYSFEGWEVDGNASLAELKDLSRLVTLNIRIPDPNILPKDLRFENLMRYKIFIGDGWYWYGDCETSRTLKLKLNTSIQEFGLYTLLERTEDLYLGEMNGIKNSLCSLNREGFPHLRHLHVQESREIEYVVNTLELFPNKAFPELRSLFLHNLINLKKICHGQLPAESFCNLRIVEVRCCDGLKNLFSLSVVKGLLQLQTLKVNECKIMDEIVSEASEGSEGNNEAMGKITFPQLRSLELDTLPKLSSFYSKKQTSRPINNYAPTTDAGSGGIISEDKHDIPIPLFNEKVAFPNLEKLVIRKVNSLTVSNCGGSLEYIFDLGGLNEPGRHVELRDLVLKEIPGLKQIWKKDPQTNFLCQKLSSLEVFGCGNLRIIFTTSMVKSLKQLRKLSITLCGMVEEIVQEEGVEEQATYKIEFPELTSLTLVFLPRIKSFCQGSCTLGTLTNQPLFSVDKVAFPNLEVLSIKEVNSLKEIWPSQLLVDDDSFCNLKSLCIESCEHLLNIIPSNMLMRLRNLESLRVAWGNHSAEYIFDVGELNDMERHVLISIPLRKLSIVGYPRLKHIWKTDSQLSGCFPFQNLTSLEVGSCHNLRHIFTTSIAKSLVQLQQLEIWNCAMVEEIVGNERVEEESMGKIEFPRLTSLALRHLPQLKSFYQGILKVETFSLESSSVEESHGKGHVGTPTKPLFLADKVVFPNLEELKLESMSSMKEIWQDQYYAASFGKLRVLEVCKCESLTHVLTFAIAKSLVQIKCIVVDNCKMMKVVIASEGEETDEITFSQLNFLKLRNLPNLTSFCARSNTFSFSSLGQVLVEKCHKLKTFSDGILHTPKLHEVLLPSDKELDKGFWKGGLNSTIQYLFEQKIEFLRLSELSELKQICHDQFPFEACCVQYLVVEKCTSLLNVVSSNILESLQNLEKITVESCDSLEQVFDLEGLDYNKIHYGHLHLEEINLTQLPKLRCLWNEYPKGILSFESLRWLNIHKCNSLRNLFSPSMILDLYQLDELKITDCLNMKEIVEEEKEAKEEAIDKIQFSLLHIILQGLPNLTSFYPGNHTLEFPFLRTMKIAGCPRIKTFTSTNEGLQETSGDGNLDVPSAALFINNKVGFTDLELELEDLDLEELELELEDFNSIKEIWQGQFHARSFRRLTTLTVRSCQSLTHLLPFKIAKSLVYIKNIIVDGCEMMKEIIKSEEGDEAITSEEGDEADYETTFSQLSSLKLRSLPNLTNFCTRSNTFSFRSLEQVLVEECPKLKNFSNGNLNTPKLERVHIQEHEWVWKGDLNTTIQHLFSQKGDHL